MLMCKYNLFIVMCKDEYRELYVSKEPILGSTCSVYCASRGTCVIHEKKEDWTNRYSKFQFLFCRISKQGLKP